MRLHREESNNGIMTKSQYSFMEKSQQSYVASETRWGKVVIDESTFLSQVEFLDISALHGIDTLELGGAGVQEDVIMIFNEIPDMRFLLIQHLSVIIHATSAQEALDFGPGPVKNILHGRRHR